MFIDLARIHLEAGRGGDGAVAWRREKYEPSGGPFGGDGGKGGDIVIETDENIRTLMDYRYKRSYKAENGENGRSKKQYGKDGEDAILKVPVGTLIKDGQSQGVIADLNEANMRYTICKGGIGGRGNAKFISSTRQAPNFAELGKKGERREIVLELKLIADIGLIGFPNVGKSTILSILSKAKPEIANYHFTTLKPNLGVVDVDGLNSFVLADIPGIIEGASEGIGLGHDFLRHIERTGILAHVIDISGFEGRDPIEDYYTIREELKAYNKKLYEKKELIIANKIDIDGSEENLQKLKEELKDKDIEIIPASAANLKGIDQLKYKLWQAILDTNYEPETFDEKHIEVIEETEPIKVEKIEDKFIVTGDFIKELYRQTDFNSSESLQHFQRVLEDQGVIDKLRELNIAEGDTVVIEELEFDYYE